jgi:hypothetical protein
MSEFLGAARSFLIGAISLALMERLPARLLLASRRGHAR